MAQHSTLSAAELTLGAGQSVTLPGPQDRMIFVCTGSLTTTDPVQIRRSEAAAGLHASGAVTLTGEVEETRVWIWTLAAGDAPVIAGAKVLMTKTLPPIAGLAGAAGDQVVFRLDRVDFPPGAAAHTHVHPGPGLRVCLTGKIGIQQGAANTIWMGPGEPWFELGPKPVFAPTTEAEPTAFIRALVLPVEWRGKNTIRYVDPADADKPKLQSYYRFCDTLVSLPAALPDDLDDA